MCDFLLHHYLLFLPRINSERGTGRRGGGGMRVKIPRDRRTMCRWIGSHFHDCIYTYLFNSLSTSWPQTPFDYFLG